MTISALYTSEYFGENQAEENDEDELRNHKELIILVKLVSYCKTNAVDRIQYSKLRRNSNDMLANLTGGKDLDFGGRFEHYICKFEWEYNGFKGLVKRIKENGKSFIVPDIERIGCLFDKIKLRHILEDKTIKPIFTEYDNSFSPAFAKDIPSEGKLIDLIYPPGVYIARYYYKEGHPVFLQQIRPDRLVFGSNNRLDPSPFYKKTNYLFKKDISKNETIFASDEWNVFASVPNGYKNLDDESINRLMRVGKKIASNDSSKPFKITIEYWGKSSDLE